MPSRARPQVARQLASAAATYRPDIDGLRAVAVLAVLAYHAWPNWFHSGFVGVDIFFVISGYLITTIIAGQLEAGRFSIADFYVRRVRRIFPALTVVLVATLGFAWVVLLQDEFLQIGRHAVAGVGFFSNLLLWHEAGYFDNAGTTKPLLHLWSLGVEEQFYIVWPLLLWLVFKRKLPFLAVAAVIFALSMAVNLLSVQSHPVAAFFSPVTRFWELMAGGVAAYLHLHRTDFFSRHTTALSLAGTALLVLSFWLISPQDLFPGWRALLPVVGAFMLIMAGASAPVNRLLLGRRIMTAIGLISYPLYLWHWPLLSFGFIIYGEKPPASVKVALLAASFALAIATYRLIELPLRARRGMRVVWSLAGAMACVGLAGLLIASGTLRERIDTHGAAPYLAALNDTDFPGATFKPWRYNDVVLQKAASPGPGLTVFLGDSVMQHYGPRVEQQVAADPARFQSVVFATAGGCPPIRHIVRLPRIKYPTCQKSTDAAYALANSAAADKVVIGAAWYGYFNGQTDLLYDDGKTRLPFPDARAQELAYESLRQSIATLRQNGKQVFLILQPPAGKRFDPRSMYTGSRFGGIYPVDPVPPFDLKDYLTRNATVRERLLAIAHQSGARPIEPTEYLCKGDICPVLDEQGSPLYTDTVHLRPSYARRAATFLDQTMTRASGR